MKRLATGAVAIGTLAALAGYAASSSQPPAADTGRVRCVVAVEPQIRMVSFAPQSGVDGGVTSIFFASLPSVAPGDLVRLSAGSGQGGPRVSTLEEKAESCTKLAKAIAGHHSRH